ncbi:MAG: hypothetical protein F6K29_32495 [Okeania sp. SIO2G5]|nr:hypothetical protein [Okeania sp. SIO2G5]
MAEQSTAFEQEQQWSLAVQRWQQALEYINQVPKDTTYYEQVFPLAASYTTALSNAQSYLKKTMALQKAQQELLQRCSAMPDICESVTADQELHVRLAGYSNDFGISELQPNLTAGLKAGVEQRDDDTDSTLTPQNFNIWISEISAIGKTMQVSIKVYNPDGTVLGI